MKTGRINIFRPGRVFLAIALVVTVSLSALLPAAAVAVSGDIRVVNDMEGSRLEVNGRPLMVFGMNWGWIPIGENYMFNLWEQPDEVIIEALSRDMPMMKDMGINALRQVVGIPPRWIEYIYRQYGIYTIINHHVGRYGYDVDGIWIPAVDYSDPRFREAVKADILQAADELKDVPGVLMWLLGNENNYGLHWSSFEIEALPEGQRDSARAKYLYSLFGEITDSIKDHDPGRVVAISNGDIQYLDIIAEECSNIDVFGTNVYRGISARDLFIRVKQAMGIPVLFTEFGADAWNAKEMREDQKAQAKYLHGQWREIYEQSSGKGGVGNAIGGTIFQWTDGWWKFGQESRLDIHDTNASWPNGGYVEDFVEGDNNMNEEWWGITAKGPADNLGLYNVYPRAAYYVLKKAFTLDPYSPTTDVAAIRKHFAAIEPGSSVIEARSDRASMLAEKHEKVRLSGLRLHYWTFSTGGDKVTTPDVAGTSTYFPSFKGFDQLQTFFADFEAKPSEAVTAKLSINVLGNVPENPIDEIFYENRGRARKIEADGTQISLEGIERVKVYQGSVTWDDRWFLLDGFYRTGHTHWGYEGDFFGLYPDAYYGENVDIYNGEAPVGFEMTGKKIFKGFKLAFGPQLWWGANPAVLLKYNREIGPLDVTTIFQEDLAKQARVTSSFAVPISETRKFTLMVQAEKGPAVFEFGGIVSGTPKIGRDFIIADGEGEDRRYLLDEVKNGDALGAKAKVTVEKGRWHWYAQGAYMGLVADGGATQTITFTGWSLKDTGSGNQVNLMTGLAVNTGNFQIGPNILWQKPIVGPIPYDPVEGKSGRTVLDDRDPFAVRANREMLGAELMITYDPTPATWMWAWDNDIREDAKFAASVGYVYRHLPTIQDAGIGILANGQPFAFLTSAGARDLGELNARIVSRVSHNTRLIAHMYVGTGEPNGSDTRLIRRFGGGARLATGSLVFAAGAKFNDWGPYDYHRDFNLTFPVQIMGDVSYTLGTPKWFGFPQTSLGIRGLWRSLDKYSPRYCPGFVYDIDNNLICDPAAGGGNGNEWEIRTYLNFAI